MTMNLIFKDYKFRASGLGHIMTNLPPKLIQATPEEKSEFKTLKTIKETGINPETKRKNGWDDTKEKRLTFLYHTVNQIPFQDSLPTGAISYLEEVFRDVYWGRRRFLQNKYLEKGNLCEEDALELLSDIEGDFLIKNDEHLSNDYIQGTPDNRQGIIRDTKTNFDMESFDKADLSSIYEWQIKAYCWLDSKTSGELCYCLVNNPLHQLEAERKSLWYKLGMPDEESEDWNEVVMQLERNMIFDPFKFKKQYPHYQFLNSEAALYIEPIFRVKKFSVTLEPDDIQNMITRVKLARNWLMEKEKETVEKLKEYANSQLP